MNWDTVEGNWKQYKGKAQQKWGELTDDDLDVPKATAMSLRAVFKQNTARPKSKRKKRWTSLWPASEGCP